MSLIRTHNPRSPDELYEEIARHHEETCDCGIESGGTIEDFGEWLYDAQLDEWGEHRFDLETCTQWIYDLFIMQSLKGYGLEGKASAVLGWAYDVVDVADFADDEYRVDLIVEHDGELIAGIQVKPESYKYMREHIKNQNRAAHASIEEPVLYLYYDYDEERFTNIGTVMSELYRLAVDAG